MIELDLQIAPFLREASVPFLDGIFAELRGNSSLDEKRYAPPPDDEDFRETWLLNLREDHQVDLEAAHGLVMNPAFGTEEPVQMELSLAESSLRGFTAARLKIHEQHLSDVSDSRLEQGDLDFDDLLPHQQMGYLGYVVAAVVQERIVASMMV
jgi:hypothetical protein